MSDENGATVSVSGQAGIKLNSDNGNNSEEGGSDDSDKKRDDGHSSTDGE